MAASAATDFMTCRLNATRRLVVLLLVVTQASLIPEYVVQYQTYTYLNQFEQTVRGGVPSATLLSHLAALILDASDGQLRVGNPDAFWDNAASCHGTAGADVLAAPLREGAVLSLPGGKGAFGAGPYDALPESPHRPHSARRRRMVSLNVWVGASATELVLRGTCPSGHPRPLELRVPCVFHWDTAGFPEGYFEQKEIRERACNRILSILRGNAQDLGRNPWANVANRPGSLICEPPDALVSMTAEAGDAQTFRVAVRYPDVFGRSGALKRRALGRPELKEAVDMGIGKLQKAASLDWFRHLARTVIPQLAETAGGLTAKWIPLMSAAFTNAIVNARVLVNSRRLSAEEESEVLRHDLPDVRARVTSLIEATFPRVAHPSGPAVVVSAPEGEYVLAAPDTILGIRGPDEAPALATPLAPYDLCALLAPWDPQRDVVRVSHEAIPTDVPIDVVDEARLGKSGIQPRLICVIRQDSMALRVELRGARAIVGSPAEALRALVQHRNPPTIELLRSDIRFDYSSPTQRGFRDEMLKLIDQTGAGPKDSPHTVFGVHRRAEAGNPSSSTGGSLTPPMPALT